MSLLQFVFPCLVVVASAQMLDILRPKTVRIDKFAGVCPKHEDAPIVFDDVKLTLKNRIHMVNVKINYKENIDEGLKLELILKRCKSKEALDSCEKYQTIKLNRLCDLLNAENKPWTPFVKMTDPPISCPLRKNIVYVRNGTFDGSAFSHLPISGWYWIVESHIIGETSNRLLMCVIIEGQLVPI